MSVTFINGPIHFTRNGSHVDTRTVCGLRVTSALNPHWWTPDQALDLPPGYKVSRVCPECAEGVGMTPWPDDHRYTPKAPELQGQLNLLDGVA